MDDAGAMCSHLGAPAWRKGIKKGRFQTLSSTSSTSQLEFY
jgi:hypothetical protein